MWCSIHIYFLPLLDGFGPKKLSSSRDPFNPSSACNCLLTVHFASEKGVTAVHHFNNTYLIPSFSWIRRWFQRVFLSREIDGKNDAKHDKNNKHSNRCNKLTTNILKTHTEGIDILQYEKQFSLLFFPMAV